MDTATAVTFDASGSTPGTNPITSYEWDFGDGSAPVTTSGPSVDHNFATPGTFNVSVTATGSGGKVSAPAGATATVLGTDNIAGGWTDAGGTEITQAAPGDTVFLEICTLIENTEAFQGSVLNNDTTAATLVDVVNFDSGASGVAACDVGGGTDVVDQFLKGAFQPGVGQRFQVFSLNAPGTGVQGLVRVEFEIAAGAGGATLDPELILQTGTWAAIGTNAPNQVTSSIPALTITP